MNHDDFREFCYKEYERTLDSIESIYKRFPFLATLLIVLVTALREVWNDNHWPQFLIRVDATIFYGALCLSAFFIAASALSFIACVVPKRYTEIGSLKGFADWRAQYRAELTALGQYTEEQMDAAIADQTSRALTTKLAEAAESNRETARRRIRWFNTSVHGAALAACALAIAAIMEWTTGLR